MCATRLINQGKERASNVDSRSGESLAHKELLPLVPGQRYQRRLLGNVCAVEPVHIQLFLTLWLALLLAACAHILKFFLAPTLRSQQENQQAQRPQSEVGKHKSPSIYRFGRSKLGLFMAVRHRSADCLPEKINCSTLRKCPVKLEGRDDLDSEGP